MSIFAQLPVALFTDNSKPVNDAYRLSIIRWKKTDDQPKPHPAVCVQVPLAQFLVEPAILQRSLNEAFNTIQDTLVRDILETQGIDKVLSAGSIPATDLDMNAVAAFAAREMESKRLSKESLEKWFDTYVSDNLLLALANRNNITDNPTSEQTAVLNKSVSLTRNAIASLASPRSNYPSGTIIQLQKVIALTSRSSDEIRDQLAAKLTKMQQPVQDLAIDL